MDKAPDAFRTISEVADELDVPQHVLRFWETRFAQIKPMKRSGGRRYYRPEDVDLLRGIRHLLYGQGYTIRGVQRILREQGVKTVQNWQPGSPLPGATGESAGSSRPVPSLHSAMEDDEEDAESILHDAVSEDDADDFSAGEGEDLGDEMSDFSTSISSSSISSWVNAAAQHRRPSGTAPPQADVPDIAATLSEPSRWDQDRADKLKTALGELIECRKMLDSVLAGS